MANLKTRQQERASFHRGDTGRRGSAAFRKQEIEKAAVGEEEPDKKKEPRQGREEGAEARDAALKVRAGDPGAELTGAGIQKG